MNVLVTDIRYRMALAAIRDLAEAGHTVYGLHYGSSDEPCPAAAYSRDLKAWSTAVDSADAARADAALIEAGRLGAVLFPVGAKTISALAKAENRGILVPSEEQLRLAGDKSRVLALAEGLNIETPRGWDTPEGAILPVVVKYRDGEALNLHAAQRYTVCTTKEQLDAAWARMRTFAAERGQEPPLIQEYICGDGFGVSCIFDREGRPVSIICHHRLREYPITGGPSAACEAIWDDGLVRRAVTLLRAMSWQGIAMVEFKGSLQRPVLMEINPRIWGSFPLTRVSKSGFSDAYVRAAAGECLPEITGPTYRPGTRMGFRLSNLAAAAAYMKKGRLRDSLCAARDAFALPDGVLESRDAKAGRVYLRQAMLRHK